MGKGKLIVLSGPSGVGKGTIKKELLNNPALNLVFSVSATTRSPRVGEVDGVDYFFITHEKFHQMIEEDAFLEYATFVSNSYGTPKQAVLDQLEKGNNVLLEIETQGGLQIMQKMPEALSIFILPPDIETLTSRLSGRGTESPEVVASRVEVAKKELLLKDHYQYNVVNDDLQTAIDEITAIIAREANA